MERSGTVQSSVGLVTKGHIRRIAMKLAKLIGAKVLAGALALTMLPAAVPNQVPLVGISAAHADPFYRGHRGGYYGGGPRYWRGHRGGYYGGPRGYYGGPRGYHRDGYYRRHRGSAGPAIAGAIVGLGVGAAIASAAQPRYYGAPRYAAAPAYGPRPWTREWYNYCSARYRSFDARSGTFQPYNGPRQLCR
ncbi:BA14K family protein [Aureimonas jatrophae]